MPDFTVPQGNLSLESFGLAGPVRTVTSPRTVSAYKVAPLYWGDQAEWTRRVAEVANSAIRGKVNTAGQLTLTASSATTTLTNAHIGGNSEIFFTARTANAAAEIGAGTMYVSAVGDGTATITHANNSQTDRTFGYVIMG